VDEDTDDTLAALPSDLERLLAGTFALMTTWYQCPQPAICHKVMENLALIARHATVSDPLRRVCRNASARWAAYLEEVEIAIASCEESREGDDDAGTVTDSRTETGPVTLH
jgi:hypothetical protein